jgi:RNA polymerase sigma factor (sigma-70 family)
VRVLDLRNSLIEGETGALNTSFSPDFASASEKQVSGVSQVRLRSETSREDQAENDESLVPYLQSDETRSEHQLEYLIEKIAKPIVGRIVQRALRVDSYHTFETDSQDLAGDAVVRILARLRTLKADPQHHPISNFNGLVATITYRTVADHLRTKNRHRTNLEKKIRRLFAANDRLSIWEGDDGNLLCGYVKWRGKHSPATAPDVASIASVVTPGELKKRNTGEMILFILQKAQQPIAFKELVDLIGEVTTVKYTPGNDSIDTLQNVATPPEDLPEKRRLLHRLLLEIQKLDINQRRALLLNMTDSYGYSIEWFLFTNIATEIELANLLDVPIDYFRELLNELPMTDKKIAKRFGMDATRVANIRKAVRERLTRARQAFSRGE